MPELHCDTSALPCTEKKKVIEKYYRQQKLYLFVVKAEKRNETPPPIDLGSAVTCETLTDVTRSDRRTDTDRSGSILCPASGHIVTALSCVAIVTVIICAS